MSIATVAGVKPRAVTASSKGADWGKEIQALSDLRLVHQIGNLSVQTGSYRGRRFVGFTLDLSNYTGTRSEKIRQIEFWTTTGRQESRRASLIYSPGASARAPDSGNATEPPEPGELLDRAEHDSRSPARVFGKA